MTTGGLREQRIAEIFAEFAELSGGAEDESAVQVMLAERCVELLGVGAARVVLCDDAGRLGPAVGVCRVVDDQGRGTGGIPAPALVEALASARRRGATSELWMRARGEVIGVVTVVGGAAEGLDPAVRQIGQALADAAANAVLAQRERRQGEQLTGQLQHALSSRVVIEQAVGILAERWQVDVSKAFELLREFVRRRNLRLRDVAEAVVGRDLDPFQAARERSSRLRRASR